MILVIDNYDSFTYNLVQYVGELKQVVEVFRNDKITLQAIEQKNPNKIILSPGPGIPKEAGILIEVIKAFSGKLPILGVCLGHQGIAEAFGGSLKIAEKIMHGKVSTIYQVAESKLFKDLPKRFKVTRYHSIIVEKDSLPAELKITALTEQDEIIMALEHTSHPTFGVQFHPESIATEHGMNLIKNFVNL